MEKYISVREKVTRCSGEHRLSCTKRSCSITSTIKTRGGRHLRIEKIWRIQDDHCLEIMTLFPLHFTSSACVKNLKCKTHSCILHPPSSTVTAFEDMSAYETKKVNWGFLFFFHNMRSRYKINGIAISKYPFNLHLFLTQNFFNTAPN